MRHCCKFSPDDVYYLEDTNLYKNRKLSIGFCPICQKPVAELVETRFDGINNKISLAGIRAQELTLKYKDEIIYSMKEINYRNSKMKPFGWKYGVNKVYKIKGKEKFMQYAFDFYGNKELIKTY